MMSVPHRWTFDDEETDRRQAAVAEAVGGFIGIIPYIAFYTPSIVYELINLRNLEKIMMDLIERPEFIHRIMRFMTDETKANCLDIEDAGKLTANNNGAFLPSGSYGFTDELPGDPFGRVKPAEGPLRLRDLWGFADTQEFTDVSPEMWREFLLPYQRELLGLFGLVYYGCCEKIDSKLDDILAIPRLRKVSVSPWSNVHLAAEKIGNKVIYCRKPNPSAVVYNLDEKQLQIKTEELLRVTEGCTLEIVLKDLHTAGNRPENLARWVEITKSVCGGADGPA